MERAALMSRNERLSDRQCRVAVRRADLNDRLNFLGDQKVAQEIAVPLRQRYTFEIALAVASPARTLANQAAALRLLKSQIRRAEEHFRGAGYNDASQDHGNC
jgi:hypothetical protein